MKKWHVYFTDAPGSPATFQGTKAEALKSARLYIRQWQIDAKIDRIELAAEIIAKEATACIS